MLAASEPLKATKTAQDSWRSALLRPPANGPVLDQLYESQNRSYLLASLLALPMIGIFDALLWGSADRAGLMIWTIGVTCAAIFHSALSVIHRNPGNVAQKLRVRCGTLALGGFCWGTLPALVLPSGLQEKSQAIVALLMVTLFAANTIFSAQLRRTFLSYQTPMIVAAAVGFAVQGNRFAWLLAGFMLYCLVCTVILHDQANRLVVGAVQLSHENTQLAVELDAERTRLADTNVELTEVNGQLEHQARFDPLTGLSNRAAFTQRVEAALEGGSGSHVGLLFIDIDRFKRINDSYGHSIGDELLIQVSRCIVKSLRGADLASRFGGDEFTVLLPDCRNVVYAMTIARRIRTAIASEVSLEGTTSKVTASIGVAYSSGNIDSPASLLRSADAALYRAKQNGRNRVEMFEPSATEAITGDVSDDLDLRSGFDSGLIRGWFQPEVDLFTGEITGAEALARWEHPSGVRNAGAFMHAIERHGMLDELTTTVALSIIKAAPGFEAAHPGFRTHLNVSAKFLHNLDRIDGFIDECRSVGFDLRGLALEVTETAVIEDLPAARAWLQRARDAGMTVFLDDFGMGYCSLGVFAQLPVDGLKIDMSFVRQLTSSPTARAIVKATMQLASDLNLQVIAEGVETEQQAEALRELGVRYAQGYLFSPAVRAKELTGWLESRAPWQALARSAAGL